ncbi:MAG: threonine synthase [Oscillospiraceae bacterium]|nr:threonine synthase [Oscillospiraceae bacterium]
MEFFSTRNAEHKVSASQAIAQGLSEEGGLFVPAEFPAVDLAAACAMEYPALAAYILKQFLTDYKPEFLEQAAAAAYGEAFGGKAGHLEQVNENTWSLELWHGPTCAFKDYALQLMPKLLVEAKKNLGRTEHTLILVATSGDTGKAALDGYKDIPGVSIVVFYPNNGTSEIQRLQMATQEGGNVAVYAVQGNFDDAQTGVKRAFADKQLAAELAEKNVVLSSANSINWGRLVPQIVYYFAAYGQLVRSGKVNMGEKMDFCVPTGNFGDILAGYYAKRMGLPVGTLVCASNRNNVLTDFFATGTYNARRDFYRTTSPSMDILVSSNLERLLYHLGGSDAKVAEWMGSLNREGSYTVDEATMAAIRADFAYGCCNDDEQVAAEIKSIYEKDGYLCDTHTAVAFKVAREYCADHDSDAPMVVLSTASPFKFPRDVLAALGSQAPAGDFEAMEGLEQLTGVQAPVSLAGLRGKAERFTAVIEKDGIADVARNACEG